MLEKFRFKLIYDKGRQFKHCVSINYIPGEFSEFIVRDRLNNTIGLYDEIYEQSLAQYFQF